MGMREGFENAMQGVKGMKKAVVVDGAFDAIPVKDGTVDLVAVAQVRREMGVEDLTPR